MEALERRLGRALERPDMIGHLFAAAMFCAHIHRTVRQAFQRRFGQAASSRRCARPARRLSPLGEDALEGNYDSASEWDWQGLARLAPALRLYELFTTCVMCFAAAKNIFQKQLHHLIDSLGLAKPAHCYLPGQLVFHDTVSSYTAILCSLFHILWRAHQAKVRRPYALDLFTFLMFSERDLRRFEARLQDAQDWVELGDGNNDGEAEFRSRATGASDARRPTADGRAASCERLFKRILCYRLLEGTLVRHKLRPNRTRRARALLRRHLAKCLALIGASALTVALTGGAWVLSQTFNDARYLRLYPNCDAHLERQRREQRRHQWWWWWRFSGTQHQLITAAVDLVLNWVVWSESSLSVIAIWGSIYLLNYDARLYHRRLDASLRALQARARHHYQAAHSAYLNSAVRFFEKHRGIIGGQLDWGAARSRCGATAKGDPHASHWPPAARHRQRRRPSWLCEDEGELARASADLQAQFNDLFTQIRAADLFISDAITSTVVIWLVLFSVLCHLSLEHFNSRGELGLLVLILTVGTLGLLVVSLISFSLVALHHACLRSYPTLCALMAYDQSAHKRKFLKLIEFYTVNARSAYTLFQQYPFTKTTFLSILGWSLSCFFISDSLLRQHQQARAKAAD